MNNIYEELYDLSLMGSVISTISGMEDIPSDAWNIELESNKYGARLSKSNCKYTDCIDKIRNRMSIKKIKAVVGNYSITKNKYSNECFNILENARHPKKQKNYQ